MMNFNPAWHRVGDPDVPVVAVAYGATAIITIWLLESIAHRLLFFSPDGPKVSHFSALVLFKDCSWIDISRWALGAASVLTKNRN